MASVFDALVFEISTVTQSTRLGRVVEVARGTVIVRGLEGVATLGDRVQIGRALGGEVVALRPDSITILTDSLAEKIALFEEAGKVMMSPRETPAAAAGKPGCTPMTITPLASSSWFSRAYARETLRTLRPHFSSAHSSPTRLSSFSVTTA